MTRATRTFEAVDPATILKPDVFAVGLYGYTGTGKTKSALELATGILRVYGGDLHFADADGRRGLHFREQYPGMKYIDFQEPYNALDFADLIAAHEHKRGVLVIDGASQEHEGEEGLIDTHAAEKERRGGDDGKNAVAWALAKAHHKILRRVLKRAIESIPIIMCWRAQNKTDWNNKDERGKTKPMALGEMPIGSMDLPFEMTATYLLPIGSRGVPCLNPEAIGEKMMTKIPDQFAGIVRKGEAFTAAHGEAMARWAMLPTQRRAVAPSAVFEGLRASIERATTGAEVEATWPACVSAAKAKTITRAEGEQLKTIGTARKTALAQKPSDPPPDMPGEA